MNKTAIATKRTVQVLVAGVLAFCSTLSITDPAPAQDGGERSHNEKGHNEKGRGRFVFGDLAVVDGNPIMTWAMVSKDGEIDQVGVTIPLVLFDKQATEPGDGPKGAIASLMFPEVVQELTFLNHFELHSQPHGHPTPPGSVNPDRNRVPHFDFHFYAIPEAQVWEIPFLPPPLPAVPADRLPVGYLQPGPSESQMGRHSAPAWSLTDPGPLSTIMIAGFLPDGSSMHFIEPMVSRERLLEANDFELPMPMPATFGQPMLYPTKFEAEYDGEREAYLFVFSEFLLVE